jgi:hypothetical protein
MSRRPPAIEQASGRKHESTRANGQQARAPRMRPAQNIEQRLRHRRVDAFPAGDHGVTGWMDEGFELSDSTAAARAESDR